VLKVALRGDFVNPNSSEPTKKPYSPPVIRVYGDIQSVTKAVTMTHLTGDNGNGNTKT